MKLRVFWLSLLLVFSTIVIIIELAHPTEAGTITVDDDGPANYATIQEAINAAIDGDVVYVYNGTYMENVVVDKMINLTGEEMDTTIIDGGGNGDAVFITADWVNMTGFTVTGGGGGGSDAGVELSNVANCYVADCNISNNGRDGLRILDSTDSVIENNYISNNRDEGIQVQTSQLITIIGNDALNNFGAGGGGTNDGILIYQSSDNIIMGNNVSGNEVGIDVLDGSSGNNISSNNASQNSYGGIYVDSSDVNILWSNNIIDNYYGIWLSGSIGCNLTLNTMVNNGIFIGVGWGGSQLEYWNTHFIDASNTANGKAVYYLKNQTGGSIPAGVGQVLLANCSGIEVRNQQISNSSVGIEVGFSQNNTITNNDVMNQINGIYVYASDENLINDNNVTSNEDFGIYIQSSDENECNNNTIWDNSYSALYIRYASNSSVTNNNMTNSYYGIYLRDSIDSNLTNNNVLNNTWGMWLRQSTFSNVTNNNFSSNEIGIRIRAAEDNDITFNEFHSNSENGISITSTSYRNWVEGNNISNGIAGIYIFNRGQYEPTDNNIIDNSISDCQVGTHLVNAPSNIILGNTMSLCGIFIEGPSVSYWNTHTIDTMNTVNGNPVYYWKDQTTGSIPGNAGQVILANCTNIEIMNTQPTFGTVGIEFGFSSSNNIALNNPSSNNWYGIYLYYSDSNSFMGNTASFNGRSGFHLGYSIGADLLSNTMQQDGIWIEGDLLEHWNTHSISVTNTVNGKAVYYLVNQTGGAIPDWDAGEVILANCTNVIVEKQELTSATVGIEAGFSSSNNMAINNLSSNLYGMFLYECSQNIIWNNTVSFNTMYGIQLSLSSNNKFYHNNIISNAIQAFDDADDNHWNETYYTCGNYWSDYTGFDNNSGPAQNIPGADGIGDTPYVIDFNSRDYYPLMNPWYYTNLPPSEPISLTASDGATYVNLSWSPPASTGDAPVIYYRVYRGAIPDGETFLIEIGNITYFNDTNVIGGDVYYYKVTAVNIYGEGPLSDEAAGFPISKPSAPLGLMAASGDSYVDLTWNPPSSDGGTPITNYTIYRGTSPGVKAFLIEIGNITFYNDITVTNGITYYYNVSAKNNVGESSFSNDVSATPYTIPDAPSNLNIGSGDSYCEISWEAPISDGGSPITNYLIYRGTLPGEETFFMEIGNITSYNDTSVSNGVTYFYNVSAKNLAGEGPLSPEVNSTPLGLPSAPQNLQVMVGDNYINISWDPPMSTGGTPVINYSIYKGIISGSETFLVEVGDVLFYEDFDVTNGDTYYYKVSAENIVGEGPLSIEVNGTPLAVPDAPLGLSVFAGDSFVDLSWNAPALDGGSPITNYKIYRGTSVGSLLFLVEIGNIQNYNDTSVSNGIKYYYKVSAVNAIGEGPLSLESSDTPTGPPTAPQNPQADSGDTYVYISWEAPVSDGGLTVTNYKIYRGTVSGGETYLADAGDSLYYNDTNVPYGSTYYYKISAENGLGEGPLSNEVHGTPVSAPGVPTGMSTISGDSYVNLSWDAPDSEGSSPITNYIIYRGTTQGGETFFIEIDDILYFNDTTVTNGLTYYYKVMAKNSVGEGPLSDDVSGDPESPPSTPTSPTGLTATSGDSYIYLTWNVPDSDGGSSITGYWIYRGTTSGDVTLLVQIGDVLFYNDTGVTNGIIYYYKVSSENAIGEGSMSTEVSAKPWKDTDGDGTPDSVDQDDDDDGYSDTVEAAEGTDPLNPESKPLDTDDDLIPDSIDTDDDNDGVIDDDDYYPLDPSKSEKPDEGFDFTMLLIILLILIVLIVVLLLVTRRRKPEEEAESPAEKKELPPPPKGMVMEEEEEAKTEEEEAEEPTESEEPGESEEKGEGDVKEPQEEREGKEEDKEIEEKPESQDELETWEVEEGVELGETEKAEEAEKTEEAKDIDQDKSEKEKVEESSKPSIQEEVGEEEEIPEDELPPPED
jgi:titin